MDFALKCKEMGIVIPPANKPGGIYSSVVRDGNIAYISGQTAKRDGVVCYPGKLGETISLEEGYAAARMCAINCLALIEELCGGLVNVDQIVKMTGYVNSTPYFSEQPKVIDGASELLYDLFGEKGLPARSSIGVAALPGNSSCEIELIVRLKK